MSRMITWQVTGMTCSSCEKLVDDVLKDVQGVVEVEVSLKRATASVRMRTDARDPDLNLLNAQLEAHGYRLHPQGCAIPSARRSFASRLWSAVVALSLVGIVATLSSPLRNLLPSVSAGASAGAMVLLGLVASVSTCLASTGGFMLAYSAETTSRRKTLLMHSGRVGAFLIGGAALGAIGGSLPSGSVVWYGLLALILGLGFLGVSLNLLDLTPSLAKLGISLPDSLRVFAERIRQRPGSLMPLLVGAVTFILPCGFTQTAQALALASGSWQGGALLMGVFALGTLPVLLGVTSFATSATLKHPALRLATGAILFFFALGQIQGGLTVLGAPIALPGASAIQAEAINREQVVRMDVRSSGYIPASFIIGKDVPVRWVINGIEVEGCNGAIVSRQLGISQNLRIGANVITFTPKQTGTIAFSCPMGMYRGTFTVVDKS